MILQGRTPRNLSWTALVLVLAVGAVLLPLWPTPAAPQTPVLQPAVSVPQQTFPSAKPKNPARSAFCGRWQ